MPHLQTNCGQQLERRDGSVDTSGGEELRGGIFLIWFKGFCPLGRGQGINLNTIILTNAAKGGGANPTKGAKGGGALSILQS